MIVAGFGFRSGARVESFADALARTRCPGPVAAVATVADKACSGAFTAFARGLAVPIQPVDAVALAVQPTPTQSDASLNARNVGSVAEAAALAAAGPGARLIAPRVVSADGMATCALARGGMV